MPVPLIADVIRDALDMGFAGKVAFHYYNEPLLYAERIAAVMDAVPEAEYLLWTNGDLLKKHKPLVARFSSVVRTAYEGVGDFPYLPDDRLRNYDEVLRDCVMCRRPWVELPITSEGDVRLCCQDWRGECVIGNVARESFPFVASQWLALAEGITSGDACPHVCLTCRGVQDEQV